jgi:hypothetical protein
MRSTLMSIMFYRRHGHSDLDTWRSGKFLNAETAHTIDHDIPIGRLAQPAAIAKTILFLVSERLSETAAAEIVEHGGCGSVRLSRGWSQHPGFCFNQSITLHPPANPWHALNKTGQALDGRPILTVRPKIKRPAAKYRRFPGSETVTGSSILLTFFESKLTLSNASLSGPLIWVR